MLKQIYEKFIKLPIHVLIIPSGKFGMLHPFLTNKKMDAINDFVIQKVKQLRTERNYSQATLATKLGVSNAFLGQIEDPTHRAKYNLTHINKLAIIFKCSPKDFLPDKPIE